MTADLRVQIYVRISNVRGVAVEFGLVRVPVFRSMLMFHRCMHMKKWRDKRAS